jgi:hypothetical protein
VFIEAFGKMRELGFTPERAAGALMMHRNDLQVGSPPATSPLPQEFRIQRLYAPGTVRLCAPLPRKQSLSEVNGLSGTVRRVVARI